MVSQYHNILLCVAGLTPQIITETLYALTQKRGERVDEIRVVTTLLGQERLVAGLLDPQHGQFFAFCRDYGIGPASIRFDHTSISAVQTSDGRTLDDIRLREENERVADRICEVVRKLTKDEGVRIHASAAGGRKTMGIFLASAMQLFGRRQDALSHVLVNEPFENHPDFFYPPPQPRLLELKDRQGQVIGQASTADARIELADIPFVRLRGVLDDWLNELPGSYGALVASAQEELDLRDAAQELRLNCGGKSVAMLNRRARLTEREFFVYLLFARARRLRLGEDGFLGLADITYDDLDETFRIISKARDAECGVVEYGSLPRFKFLKGLLREVQQQDMPSLQATITEVLSKIKSSLERNGLPDRCRIVAEGRRGALKYGLKIAPERIHWR
jgi:CRISPR-associated protein (TIGR02584 family)